MIFPFETKIMDNGCIAFRPIVKGRKKDDFELEKRRGVSYDKKIWGAARLSYHLNVEPIPISPPNLKEGFVCHHCDIPWCINPDHLYLGTAKQNAQDALARNKTMLLNRSKALKGKPKTEEHKAKLRVPHSQEHNENMRKATTGLKRSPETLLRMSAATKKYFADHPEEKLAVGKFHSEFRHKEETKKRISETLKGNSFAKGHRHTDEARKKMSLSKIGKSHSPEHTAKVAASLRSNNIKRIEINA